MFEKRIIKIQNALEKDEALIVTSSSNRLYFTGFESSAGAVFATKNAVRFLIDFRYFEKAKRVVKHLDVRLSVNPLKEINEFAEKENIKRIFIEADALSVSQYNRYREVLKAEVSNSDKMSRFIEDMRAVKSEEELGFIKKAQAMTDETFSYILNNIKAGRTEREVMLDMEFFMRKLGSEGVSFDFIVVSGKNSSLPHGVPTDKKIENGDFVTMDFGAVVSGYRSDMTRTVAVGDVTFEQREIYNTVLKAQKAAIKEIKAGKICKDIDKIARDIINSAGYEGCFGHGLGHSVGIEIHENPNFNTRCETVLKSGTVMTVEPGIYIENKYGVRIEDMVYVTDKGCKDITNSEKDLIIL